MSVAVPSYFIEFSVKDFFKKSYVQELIEEYPYRFDRAVLRWTEFVGKYRNGKLTIRKITPADLFEFCEKFTVSDMTAIACLCFVYKHVAEEGFLIE